MGKSKNTFKFGLFILNTICVVFFKFNIFLYGIMV